eukprot:747227-Hanusia_phi.AAC.1
MRGMGVGSGYREQQGMWTTLYVAPAALGDYCDSSGCLPGQVPLPGLKATGVLDKRATSTMEQVLQLARACKRGEAPTSECT